MRHLHFLTLLILLIAGQPAFGAPERWVGLAETVFDHIDRDAGLPHDSVTALAQDAQGFLWVGTLGGLARYDGYRFKVFKEIPDDPHSLPANYIKCLLVDDQGQLWVGTSSAGLARYDAAADSFIRYASGSQGLSNPEVRALASDGAGGVWVGTAGGLDHVDAASTVERYDPRPGAPGAIADTHVIALLHDRTGELWVGTATGLAHRHGTADPFTDVHLPLGAAGKSAGDGVFALFEDQAGRVWFGTRRSGVGWIDADGVTAHFIIATADGEAPGDNWIAAIREARPGLLWIATYGRGILSLDTATGRFDPIRRDPLVPASLSDDHVAALLRDRMGLMWTGTQRGLSHNDPANLAVKTLFGAASRPGGPSDVDIESVMVASNGHVWLGTRGNGVDIVDPVAGGVGALRPRPLDLETALPGHPVLSFAEAGDHVWIGTVDGLYRADAEGQAVAHVPLPRKNPSPSVLSLLAQGDALWVGTYSGLGRYEPATGKFTDFSAGLSDSRITVLHPTAGGQLWVGTFQGLNLLDPATGRVERIPASPADPTALSGGHITALLDDRDGRLWVGTLGGGISILDRPDDAGARHFRRLARRDGLPHENIDALLHDGAGRIWASTSDGLAVIDPGTLQVRALGRAEGVAIRAYWVRSAAETASGDLLFGGLGGVSVVEPEQLDEVHYRPALVVTEARIGRRTLQASELARPITLRPEDRGFELEFASLDFSAPGRLRYAHRLDGFDPDWIESDANHRLVSYSGLPPGDYRLLLRSTDRDGAPGPTPLAIAIHVQPAWYQTLAASMAGIVLILATVAGTVRMRTGYLRQRQRLLEREVAERTAELRQSLKDLDATRAQLERLAMFDPLTGAGNRRLFQQQAAIELADSRRTEQPLGLVMFDIDHFKTVNDRWGHAVGDLVLQKVVETARDLLRPRDFLTRLGGEEFALLLPGTGIEEAVAVAERLRRAIAGHPMVEDDLRVTVSLGVTLVGHAETAIGPALDRADAALYRAKQGGRDRVEAAAVTSQV